VHLDLALKAGGMYLYSIIAVVEENAALGALPTATIATYSVGRCLWPCRNDYDNAVALNGINPIRENKALPGEAPLRGFACKFCTVTTRDSLNYGVLM